MRKHDDSLYRTCAVPHLTSTATYSHTHTPYHLYRSTCLHVCLVHNTCMYSIFCWEHIFSLICSSNDRKLDICSFGMARAQCVEWSIHTLHLLHVHLNYEQWLLICNIRFKKPVLLKLQKCVLCTSSLLPFFFVCNLM